MARINPQLNIDPVSPIFTGSLSANGITSTGSFLSNGSKWVQDSSGFTIQNLSNINLFRATTATAFTDSATAYFFQIGNSSGNHGVIQSYAGNTLGRLLLNSPNIVIDSAGYGSVPVPTGALEVRVNTASQVGQVIRGATSQTGDLQRWQTWDGTTATTATYVRNDGLIHSTAGYTGQWAWINGYRANTTLAATANNDSAPTVIFRALAGQTQDLLRLESSTPATIFKVGPTGDITGGYAYLSGLRDTAGTGPYLNTTSTNFLINARTATNMPLIVQGAASQSANLTEWRDSSNNAWASVSPSGSFNSNNAIGYQIASAAYYGSLNSGNTARIQAGASVATNPHVVIRQVSGATGNLQEWQDSSGNILSRVSPLGSFIVPVSGSFISGQTGQSFFAVAAPTNVVTVIRGAASQTADLQQWQDSSSTILAYVSSAGSGYFGGNVSAGIVGGLGARLNVQPGGASVVGTIVRGATSQTADLQQWQMWDGTTATTKAYVTADGSILTSATLTGSGNLRVGGLSSTGGGLGVIGISNATTVPASSPTGGGILYVDTGALKYLGTSGSAATIINANSTFGTHTHAGTDITSGTIGISYLPTGTTGTTVALGNHTHSGVYEPVITSGTTAQYWRGDKSWQTLDKSAVGLGNVENTALSTWAGSSNITTIGTISNDVVTSGYLKSNNSSGDEGGEIFLSKSVTNTTLNTGVTIDVYQNKLRFFEQGGTARGYYIDITTGGAGVGTNLVGGGSSFTGGTLTSNLTLVAGGTTTYPLTFQNNGVAPNANLGSMDFSSSTGLQFTNNATTGKGSVNVSHIYSIASDGATYTTDSTVSAFPALTNGISLESGVRYEFEGVLMLYNFATFFSSGTTSCTLTLGFALPTVTYAHADFNYSVGTSSTFGSATDTLTYNAVTTALGTGVGISTATRSTAGTDNRYAYVRVRGHLKTSASGNFRPTVNYAGTGIGAYGGNIMAGSWISIRKTPETMGAWT